ncbi:MAG: ribosome maturation factor [Candidatus Mycalebacterium zealandia]|nr:MAG: ribosome maturation factor [Candidatus Mycalebacterium zealandia]
MQNRIETRADADRGGTAARLSKVVERVIAPSPLELVDLRLAGGGKVSVFVDKPGGVNIAECADLSREIGVLIDIEEIMQSPYTLEVSSPGVERPLTKPTDYDRFSGRRAKVRTKDALEGRRVFTGRIEGIESGFVKLLDEESDGEVFSIPFDGIEKANLKREL